MANDYLSMISDALNKYKLVNSTKPSALSSADYKQQATNQINSMIADTQSSELARLKMARDKALQGYNTQKTNAMNQYQGTTDIINQRKNETTQRNNLARTNMTNEYQSGADALNQAKAQAAPGYQNQRNQVDVQTAQNANKIREIMASQGLINSGESVTGQIANQTNNQNAMNDINTNEQNFNNDISRQLADLAREKAGREAELNLNEQQTLTDYDRQLTENDRAKVSAMNDIDEKIRMLEEQGATEDNALVKELNAQKTNMLLDLLYKSDERDMQLDEIANNRNQQEYANALNAIGQQYNIDSNERNYNASRDDALWNRGMAEKEYSANREDAAWNKDFSNKQFNSDTAFRDKEFNANREDALWNRGMSEKEFNANREDSQWNKDFSNKQFEQQKADTAWNQAFQNKEYDANRADTAWNQAFQNKEYDANRDDAYWNRDFSNKQFDAGRDDEMWNRMFSEKQFDFQKDSWAAEFNAGRDDAKWNQNFQSEGRDYEKEYNDWQKAQKEKEYADSRSDTERDYSFRDQQYADSRSDTAWQQGIEEQRLALAQKESEINAAIQSGQLSLEQGRLALAKVQADYDMSSMNPDNLYKMSQIKAGNAQEKAAKQNAAYDYNYTDARLYFEGRPPEDTYNKVIGNSDFYRKQLGPNFDKFFTEIRSSYNNWRKSQGLNAIGYDDED